jgi:hypothetical protein
MKDIHIQYKRETGNAPENRNIEIIADDNHYGTIVDDEILDYKSLPGWISIPDPEYMKWLEEKVEEPKKVTV